MNSGKWQLTFCSESLNQKPPVSSDEHSFLSRLAAEYKSCKDKDINKEIRKNAAKQSQKVLVGDSLKKSKISWSGKTSEMFSSRVLRTCADEKRRLLLIVALDYSYSILQRYFQCSSKTVTAAREHCILFGRGGVPVDKLKFTRQCVSAEVLQELSEFLYRDDVSQVSSCRSVLVQGEETVVRYWQDTIKGLVNQYLLEFPNGAKRTYPFFVHRQWFPLQ